MRKFIRISVLVLALAIPAFAGNIPNNVTGNIPNNDTVTSEVQDDDTGDIPNGVTGNIPYGAAFVDALLSLFSLI
jgi:hypothetical protein